MEPTTSSTAAGVAGWKFIGGAAGAMGIGAAFGTIVVMLMTPPRSPKEWAVGLICSVVGSIAGGAYAIIKLGLLAVAVEAHDLQSLFLALCAMIGVAFACALPAWAIVRWVFTYIQNRQAKDIADVLKEAKDLAR